MNKEKEQPQTTWNTQNIFSGTSWYYSRYRPGYPEEMFNFLKERLSLDKFSRVLDLGCGTGQIALPMAACVSEVIAIDPQKDMLNELQTQLAARNYPGKRSSIRPLNVGSEMKEKLERKALIHTPMNDSK